MQYNSVLADSIPGTVLKYEWSNDKLGKIKEFEEKVTVGDLTVKGHYDAKKNVTIIEKNMSNNKSKKSEKGLIGISSIKT